MNSDCNFVNLMIFQIKFMKFSLFQKIDVYTNDANSLANAHNQCKWNGRANNRCIVSVSYGSVVIISLYWIWSNSGKELGIRATRILNNLWVLNYLRKQKIVNHLSKQIFRINMSQTIIKINSKTFVVDNWAYIPYSKEVRIEIVLNCVSILKSGKFGLWLEPILTFYIK